MRDRSSALKLDSAGEPLVDQGTVHGWPVTWNPDDQRFYVGPDQQPVTSRKDWRNAVQWCKAHKAEAAT